MIKILIIIFSLGFGILTTLAFKNLNIYQNIGVVIGFTFVYIICFVALFFILFFFEVIFENKNKKRIYQSKYYRFLLHIYNKFLFSLFNMKIIYQGKELLNMNEQYLIVCNHRSNLDSLIIDNYLYEMPLVFVAKKSLFQIPFVGRLIHGCAYIKIDRENFKQEFYAIKDAIDFIGRKEKPLSIGIFPEGTRGKREDKLTNDFKAGSLKLLLKLISQS